VVAIPEVSSKNPVEISGKNFLAEDKLDVILDKFDGFSVPGQAIEAIGVRALKATLKDCDPFLVDVIDEAAEELEIEEGFGFFIIRQTGLDKLDLEQAHIGSLVLSTLIGTPLSPGPGFEISGDLIDGTYPLDTPIRHLKTAPDVYKARIYHPILTKERTFYPNGMVTSSPYLHTPEQITGLFNLADYTEIGLVDSSNIRSNLSVFDERSKLLDSTYPFMIPEWLRSDSIAVNKAVLWATVLAKDRNIVFDKHSIDAALDVSGVSISPQQYEALAYLDALISDTELQKIELAPGDVVVINNQRMLHEIRPVGDDSRTLIKVGIRV
jgi:hypothetical protein